MHGRRTRDRAQLRIDGMRQFSREPFARARRVQPIRVAQHDERERGLPLQRIRDTHHRHFRDRRMTRQRLLDLARAEPMPRHVDDVVGAPEYRHIAVFVLHAPVEGRIDCWFGTLFQ